MKSSITLLQRLLEVAREGKKKPCVLREYKRVVNVMCTILERELEYRQTKLKTEVEVKREEKHRVRSKRTRTATGVGSNVG